MSFYICQEHRLAWPSLTQFAGHWNWNHRGQPRPPDKDVLVEEIPEGYKASEAKGKKTPPSNKPGKPKAGGGEGSGTEKKTVYGPSQDPNQVLLEILQGHPGLPASVVEEVMSWTKYKPSLHPNEVSWILMQMPDVPKGAPAIIQTKYSLALSNITATPGPGGVTPTFGSPGPGGISPIFALGGGGIGGQGYPPGASLTPQSPEIAELRQQVNTLHEDFSQFLARMEEKERREEAERLEAQHKAEIQEIVQAHKEEAARLEAAHKEDLAHLEKQMEALQKPPEKNPVEQSLRDELQDLKERLRLAESQRHEAEVSGLKSRITDLEKQGPASPTELGVIQHTADKALDTLQGAGTALRDIVIGAQKGQGLFPGRRSPAEREAVGQELLTKAKQSEALVKEMDELFAKG